MRLLATALMFLLLPVNAFAECVGQNLIAALPADQRAMLQAAADATPFAHGNLWSATKGDASDHPYRHLPPGRSPP